MRDSDDNEPATLEMSDGQESARTGQDTSRGISEHGDGLNSLNTYRVPQEFRYQANLTLNPVTDSVHARNHQSRSSHI